MHSNRELVIARPPYSTLTSTDTHGFQNNMASLEHEEIEHITTHQDVAQHHLGNPKYKLIDPYFHYPASGTEIAEYELSLKSPPQPGIERILTTVIEDPNGARFFALHEDSVGKVAMGQRIDSSGALSGCWEVKDLQYEQDGQYFLEWENPVRQQVAFVRLEWDEFEGGAPPIRSLTPDECQTSRSSLDPQVPSSIAPDMSSLFEQSVPPTSMHSLVEQTEISAFIESVPSVFEQPERSIFERLTRRGGGSKPLKRFRKLLRQLSTPVLRKTNTMTA